MFLTILKNKTHGREQTKPSPRLNLPRKSIPLNGERQPKHQELTDRLFEGRQVFSTPQNSYILSITRSRSHKSCISSSSSVSYSSSSSSSSSSSVGKSLSPSSSFPSSSPALNPEQLFATESFVVRLSPKGGYGAFAIKDIHKDSVIITEAALFTGRIMEVFHLYEMLERKHRDDYMTLHAHTGFGTHKILSIFKTNR